MAAREQADQDAIDDILLPYNNFGDFLAYLIEPGDGYLQIGIGLHHHIVGQTYAMCWTGGRSARPNRRSSSRFPTSLPALSAPEAGPRAGRRYNKTASSSN